MAARLIQPLLFRSAITCFGSEIEPVLQHSHVVSPFSSFLLSPPPPLRRKCFTPSLRRQCLQSYSSCCGNIRRHYTPLSRPPLASAQCVCAPKSLRERINDNGQETRQLFSWDFCYCSRPHSAQCRHCHVASMELNFDLFLRTRSFICHNGG